MAETIIKNRADRYDVRECAFGDALKQEVNEAVENYVKQGWTTEAAFIALCKGADTQCVTSGAKDHLGQPFRVSYDPNPDTTDPRCPYGKQRLLLQWWGTNFRRAQNPFYWVRKLEKTLASECPQIALITDMRFPNELHWVKDHMEGVTVKVQRLGFDNGLTHPSETALDGFSFDYDVLCPDGQLDELKRDAVELFDLIVQHQVPAPTPDQMKEWFERQEQLSEEVRAAL